MSEGTSRFVTEYADFLLKIAEQGDRRIVSELVHFLCEITFDTNIFKAYTISLAICKEVSSRRTRKAMKDDEFRKFLKRGSSTAKYNQCTLLKKDMTEVPQELVEFCKGKKIMRYPERRDRVALQPRSTGTEVSAQEETSCSYMCEVQKIT